MRNYKLLIALSAFVLFLLSCGKKSNTPPNPTNPTVPGCASNAAPANGSFVTSTTVTLSWSAVSGATGYDVYLGTTSNPTTAVASGITSTNYVYTITASTSTAYFWYVVPKNAGGAAAGCSSAVSSFNYAVIQPPAPFGYYVVGYVPSYRSITSMPDVKFRMTNVVVYAFYAVNGSGTLSAPASPSSTLVAVRDKARANNAKVLLGINDGAAGNFKNMASTAAGRNNFIKDVMNTVRANNLDGVDMDWEFPSTSDGTDVTFTALMKELSDSLHRDGRYYLSCAITAGKYAGGIRDAIRNEIFPYVDFFNIMAYDDFTTDPLQQYRHHSDYTLAQVCLNYWLNTRGMPASKAVLGVPAYGRPSGMTQSGNIVTYNGVLLQGGNAQYDSAMVTTTATPTPFKVYYNGQYTTKRKAKLAKDIANGVMFWEKGQDAMDNNSLLKAACDTVGRSY
jgi:GH18 family chitinase